LADSVAFEIPPAPVTIIGMDDTYAQVIDGDATLEDLKRAKDEFWSKMKSFLGKVPFARDAVALFYLIKDPSVSFGLRSSAVLALLYFIAPVDFVPDAIPLAGLVDDGLVIAAAMTVLSDVLSPFRGKADEWLARGAKPEPEVVKSIEVEQH
jgi:uncharacterized membrane protein YkvA (DUF1232 family)